MDQISIVKAGGVLKIDIEANGVKFEQALKLAESEFPNETIFRMSGKVVSPDTVVHPGDVVVAAIPEDNGLL